MATMDNKDNGEDDNDDDDSDDEGDTATTCPVNQSTHHRHSPSTAIGVTLLRMRMMVSLWSSSVAQTVFDKSETHPHYPSGRYSVVSSSSPALRWLVGCVCVCVLGGVGDCVLGGVGVTVIRVISCVVQRVRPPSQR